MLYGIAQALESATCPAHARPACPSHLTRVLCLASASSFRLAEGAARCVLPPPTALPCTRIACLLTYLHHLPCAGFDKAVEECKYRMSRYGVTCAFEIKHPYATLYHATLKS